MHTMSHKGYTARVTVDERDKSSSVESSAYSESSGFMARLSHASELTTGMVEAIKKQLGLKGK